MVTTLQLQLLFAGVVGGLLLCCCEAGEHAKRLYSDLMDGYNVLVRPVLDDRKPVLVKLGLTLQQIIDVDEKNQIIQLNIWLNFQWEDEYLKWDPAEYGGINQTRLPSGNIWKPDILLYNSVDEKFDTVFPVNTIANYDGTITWVPPGIVKSNCKIDIKWFPFDDQHCEMKFGSWTYSGYFVDLRAGDVDTSTYIQNGEWLLIGVTANRTVFKYPCCPEPYPDVKFYIHIRRRTLYYGFNLIIPCLLISLMTLLDFILPPDSGEKLTLGITIFMSLCVFLLMVAEAMPPTSDAVPLIGVYFVAIMIVVSLTQVFTVLVINFHHRKPETHEMSPFMKGLFLNWLPWLLFMRRPGYVVKRGVFVAVSQDDDDDIVGGNRKDNNAAAAGSCNSAVNQRFSASLLSNVINSDDDCQQQVDTHMKWLIGNNSSQQQQQTLMASSELRLHDSCATAARLTNLELLLKRILKELQFISTKYREIYDDEEIENDWKFAAMVLDRLCLLLFTTILLVSTCAIIFAAPHVVV